MNGKRFIDTNIAIYALDVNSSKGRIASELGNILP